MVLEVTGLSQNVSLEGTDTGSVGVFWLTSNTALRGEDVALLFFGGEVFH